MTSICGEVANCIEKFRREHIQELTILTKRSGAEDDVDDAEAKKLTLPPGFTVATG